MKRVLTKALRIALIIMVIILLITAVFYVNHRIQSEKERELLTPIGKTVTVNGKQMSVYTQGSGDITLVFMSGSGTCSPILDFKALYSQFGDEYTIAVPEKFGYGFSDTTDSARDADTILDETRTALSAAGVKAPYILLPHSMSGIEALRWAEKYPEEVTGIVGLDMATPQAYELLDLSSAAVAGSPRC